MKSAVLVLFVLGVAASSAHAQLREAPNRQGASFWREVNEPGRQRADELVRQAREWMARAESYSVGGGEWEALCRSFPASQTRRTLRHEIIQRSVAFENAIARLERARVLAPQDARIAFLLAYATESWRGPSLDCTVERRDREAIALFEAARELDPQYRAEDVAFELGILHSRLAEPHEAAEEYRRRLTLSLSAEGTSSVHGNLAEVLMLSGNLNEAVFHYEEAVRIAETHTNNNTELPLALFGLAVALDRLGERTASLDRVRRAMSVDNNSMAILRSRGVFFVPAYELHYLEALGQLARTDSSFGPLRAEITVRSTHELVFDAIENILLRPLTMPQLRELARAISAWLSTATPISNPAADEEMQREIRAHRAARPEGRPTTIADPQRRIACELASARSFTRYLDEGGSSSMWAPNARSHITRIARDIVAIADTAASNAN